MPQTYEEKLKQAREKEMIRQDILNQKEIFKNEKKEQRETIKKVEGFRKKNIAYEKKYEPSAVTGRIGNGLGGLSFRGGKQKSFSYSQVSDFKKRVGLFK